MYVYRTGKWQFRLDRPEWVVGEQEARLAARPELLKTDATGRAARRDVVTRRVPVVRRTSGLPHRGCHLVADRCHAVARASIARFCHRGSFMAVSARRFLAHSFAP